MLMSKRKKRIYNQLQSEIDKKKEVAENLESKRKNVLRKKNQSNTR